MRVSSQYRALRQLGKPIEDGVAWPRPMCPFCWEGHVAFSEPSTDEDSASKRARANEYWEPEWISGRFISAGRCDNPECEQTVKSFGVYSVGETTRHEIPQYSAFYRVEYLSPALKLLALPEDVPGDVDDAIERAERVLFLDPGLAATALRASVERFLTHVGIPSERDNGGFMTLDARLKEWKRQTGHDRAAALFLAVKWIGNRGTHEVSDLSVDDVIDGAEFIGEAFHALFTSPGLDARAQSVNERKGHPHKVLPHRRTRSR
ncbi:DUF4145 domain-containing protein [Agromyces kandeliae]|uniref:DUF4145 domain-containing protein n=1 Tax=Agromyces kandeliae TaxID=2666141 RepID=UPI0018A1F21D|nr:DUF4145 domain-containing protein [Agromyces kandeliae]